MAGRITNDRFRLGDYTRNIFAARVPEGTTLADVEASDYWVPIAAKLRPGDRVEVFPEDISWIAVLVATDVSGNNVTFAQMSYAELAKPALEKEGSVYKIVFSPKTKHTVIRNSDKETMRSGFPNKAAALDWLKEFESEAELI